MRPEDIQDSLWKDRRLVRTWCMRGTLHVLTAQDLPLYVVALRTHDRWWKGAWLRMIGFSAPELRAILDAIHRSLTARPITREQLAEKVAERSGPRARERMLSGWGEMLKPAAFEASLIYGPPQGQSMTFVRPDPWIGRWREPKKRDGRWSGATCMCTPPLRARSSRAGGGCSPLQRDGSSNSPRTNSSRLTSKAGGPGFSVPTWRQCGTREVLRPCASSPDLTSTSPRRGRETP